MSREFVHLHVHTDYSLLDGACIFHLKKEDQRPSLESLCKRYNMPAVAITDHGFMGGAIDFYNTMNDAHIKPIIGCEAYVSPTTMDDRDPNRPHIRGFHLVLLAENMEGYRNLCKINTAAWMRGQYYKPRVDKQFLRAHSQGLIALSACLVGEIPSAILENRVKDAKAILEEYLDIFGRDNFLLEIMDHGIPEQRQVNRELILLGKEFDVPLVATNDAHYLTAEHARSHELLLCVQTRTDMKDDKRFRFSSDQFYLRSGDEMAELFKEVPESITNTLAVAERCSLEFVFAPQANHYPVYQIADGRGEREYLRSICMDGMPRRYGFSALDEQAGKLTDEQKGIIERLDYELGVIDKSKYCSYFLVVWDFINHSRQTGVPVGPGRGSGAGSLVAYLTGITNVDPLKYDLLFERFLNPERVSPPDFDIDFCERRRGEVIDYVRNKYGKDNVAQIGTYNTLKAKQLIKDIARVLGHPPAMANEVTKIIPGTPNTLDEAKKDNRELREILEKDTEMAKVFQEAEPLGGLNRNLGVHAAGVIIGDQSLDNIVPLWKGSNDEAVTQYPAGPCELLGLLKMDFLGLRTLTIIQDALDNIKQARGQDIDIDRIPEEDSKTFDLINRGDTVAVFQLESSGMQNLCRQFGVENIRHIIALIAIYRPGPMAFIPDFISRKMGKTRLDYDHPLMEETLRETYGIMLYQEQIMQVVQRLAGFSLGQADILRRAIGKKKPEVLEEQRGKFIKGCADTNNIGEKLASAIWEKIAMFAGYGFNKSHSAAYGILAYQTAYLKANYPVEFMAAVLSSELADATQIRFFIGECAKMGVGVLPPDINASEVNFGVDGDSIRFGLGAIKGVGGAATNAVIAARRRDGKFDSVLELCERVGESLNTRMLECMARCGAFDSFGVKRAQLVAVIEPLMKQAQDKIADAKIGQGSLFDFLDDSGKEEMQSVSFPDIPEYDESEMLKDEKELIGFYLSGHPLSKHADLVKSHSSHRMRGLTDIPPDTGVRFGGLIKSVQKKVSKKNGAPYAIVHLEDLEAGAEFMVYERTFEACKEFLAEDVAVFIEGHVNQREEGDQKNVVATKVMTVDEALENLTTEIHIHVYEGTNKRPKLEALRKLCAANRGGGKVIVVVKCAGGEVVFVEAGADLRVRVSEEFLATVQDIFGENRCRLKPDPTPIAPRQRFRGNGD